MCAGRTHHLFRAVIAATIAALSLVVTAGCGGPTTTTSARAVTGRPTTTSTTASPSGAPAASAGAPSTANTDSATKVEIERAYRNAIRAVQEDAAIPDPGYSALATYNTGTILEQWRLKVTDAKTRELIVRSPTPSVASITIRSIDITGTSATLTICEVDDGEVVNASTGQILNDRVASADQRATMTRIDGSWRLSTRDLLAKRTGVSC